MKKLIVSISMLLVAALMLSASTFAWFSMNRTVTASGMQVKASSSQSLVIETTTPVANKTSVAFTSGATELTPATHDSTYATYASGLKYLSGGTVDSGTGAATSPTYANGTADTHYKDFVVYIASAGGQLTGQDLVVTFSNVETLVASYVGQLKTQGATTVDFYVDTPSSSATALSPSTTTYKGSLCVSDPDSSVTLVDNGTIPQNNSTTNLLRVTMRVFIDGDLGISYVKPTTAFDAGTTYYTLKSDNKTFEQVSSAKEADFAKYFVAAPSGQRYVNTDKVDTTAISLSFDFEATAHTA